MVVTWVWWSHEHGGHLSDHHTQITTTLRLGRLYWSFHSHLRCTSDLLPLLSSHSWASNCCPFGCSNRANPPKGMFLVITTPLMSVYLSGWFEIYKLPPMTLLTCVSHHYLTTITLTPTPCPHPHHHHHDDHYPHHHHHHPHHYHNHHPYHHHHLHPKEY